MRRSSPAIAALVVLGAVAISGCRRESPAPPPSEADAETAVPVAAEPAQRGRLRAVIRTTGVVTPAAGADFLVVSSETARLLDVPRNKGDAVAAGDVLVRFDVPSAAAAVTRQRAEVARALAQLDNSRIAQGRARDLLERGIISRREMEDADREVAAAQAELGRGETALATADASVARATVRAPFAGVVAERFHNPGDLVQGVATDPILRVVDPGRLEVLCAVSAADAPRVLPGATGRLTAADVAIPLRLTVASGPSSSAAGRAEKLVRLVFAELPAIPVDTHVDVEIDDEERVDAVLVPAEAIVRKDGDSAIWIAAGNTAERRPVMTGLSDEEHVEITSGVSPGELVITRGYGGLTEGDRISVDVRR